ncbi:hypothetical protein SBADM41S_08925 [Streptomyces badius]
MSRRCHRWCSNSRSRAPKSGPTAPWRARRRNPASDVANDSYSATARAAARPRARSRCQWRARSRAMPRARMEESAVGSAGVSQPAAAYAGSSAASVRSSRWRDQIASQVTSANAGTMTIPYTA